MREGRGGREERILTAIAELGEFLHCYGCLVAMSLCYRDVYVKAMSAIRGR